MWRRASGPPVLICTVENPLIKAAGLYQRLESRDYARLRSFTKYFGVTCSYYKERTWVLAGRARRLKRLYSLKKNRDFQFTYRVGKSVGCRLFTLVYVRDRRKPRKPKNSVLQAGTHVRVGFCVSKKVGNSVQRNRVKRRLREALSPYLNEIFPGHNLIFIARPGVLDEPFLSLRQTLLQMLKKAELYKGAKANQAQAEETVKGADLL